MRARARAPHNLELPASPRDFEKELSALSASADREQAATASTAAAGSRAATLSSSTMGDSDSADLMGIGRQCAVPNCLQVGLVHRLGLSAECGWA